MSKQDQAAKFREISESAQALVDAADEAADAFEAEPGEFTKEDRDDLENEVENVVRELLMVIPPSMKR